ncbi:MAG: cytochrome P450, partial [Acidimicrobiia bacterium]|nr:cytochrome P450 [Acidimicrobiia bacterium]
MTATTPETFNPDATIAEIFSSAEGRKDPYSRYRSLRENTPVHVSPEGALWYLSNFEDCRTVLRDPRLGKTPRDVVRPSLDGAPESLRAQRSEDAPASSMLFLNPPDHTRLRSLVSREFTPKRIDDLRPRMDALAAPMLDGMARAGTADVMEELAWRLPVAVIGELVGVPEEDRESFRGTVRDLVVLLEVGASQDETERGIAAGARLRIYFRELIAKKRLNPTEDLLTALIAVEEAGDRLSEEELITTMILLFAAGFETTTNLIGNGLWLL